MSGALIENSSQYIGSNSGSHATDVFTAGQFPSGEPPLPGNVMAGNFPTPEGLTVVKGKWNMGWREGGEDKRSAQRVSEIDLFSPTPQKSKI